MRQAQTRSRLAPGSGPSRVLRSLHLGGAAARELRAHAGRERNPGGLVHVLGGLAGAGVTRGRAVVLARFRDAVAVLHAGLVGAHLVRRPKRRASWRRPWRRRRTWWKGQCVFRELADMSLTPMVIGLSDCIPGAWIDIDFRTPRLTP